MLIRSIAGFTVAAVVFATLACSAVAVAQPTISAEWQVSLDNGFTWQSGSVAASQSQSSVLVRAVTTVSQNGVPIPNGSSTFQGPVLTSAQIEGWSLTTATNADTIDATLCLSPAVPSGFLMPMASAARREGGLLFVDRRFDATPPGQGAGLVVRNYVDGLGSNANSTNPLAIFQMRLILDGTLGDRILSGAFVGHTTFIAIPAGSVAVGNPSTASDWQAVAVTQIPATLTIIPAPAAVPLLAAGSLLAMRRRR